MDTSSDEEIMMIEEIIADDVRKTFWKTTIVDRVVEENIEVITIGDDEELLTCGVSKLLLWKLWRIRKTGS